MGKFIKKGQVYKDEKRRRALYALLNTIICSQCGLYHSFSVISTKECTNWIQPECRGEIKLPNKSNSENKRLFVLSYELLLAVLLEMCPLKPFHLH